MFWILLIAPYFVYDPILFYPRHVLISLVIFSINFDNIFTKDNIETYISYKRENEVSPMDTRPHPHEFNLYYDV